MHSVLHPNCHHQLYLPSRVIIVITTYAKFNLKIYYPSPYELEIWHYERDNVNNKV